MLTEGYVEHFPSEWLRHKSSEQEELKAKEARPVSRPLASLLFVLSSGSWNIHVGWMWKLE